MTKNGNKKFFSKLQKYIDDNYFETWDEYYASRCMGSAQEILGKYSTLMQKISEFCENRPLTFSEVLFYFIDDTKMDEVECYKKAHVDRRVFSKIRCDRDYKPSKLTVIKFIFALKLNNLEVEYLMNVAGFSFYCTSLPEVIIKFFIFNEIYDTDLLDETLDKYGYKGIFCE